MTGKARFHGAEVQFNDVGVLRFALVPEPLLLRVLLDGIDMLRGPSREPEIIYCFRIDGEESHGGPVLRGHVGDRRPVCQFQVAVAGAEEFNEFAYDALLPEDLHYREHKVGGVHARFQLAREPESYDLRDVYVAGLSHHDRLRFNAAHTPADNAEAVYLRGVGICAEA